MKLPSLVQILVATGAVTTLVACDTSVDSEHIDKLADRLGQKISETGNKVSEITPSRDELSSLTSDEFAKLSIWEYKVFEVTSVAGPEEVEAALAVQGRERWDCFAVHEIAEKHRFFCKRRPETYLRYIPRWFPF